MRRPGERDASWLLHGSSKGVAMGGEGKTATGRDNLLKRQICLSH